MSVRVVGVMRPSLTHTTMKCSGIVHMPSLAWVLLSMCVLLLPGYLPAAALRPMDNLEHASTRKAVAHGVVTITSNVRDAPSMKGEVVGILQEGLPVDILTETGQWYFIRTSDGLEAWIYKPLVAVEPAMEPQPEAVEVSPPPVLAETEPQAEPTSEPMEAPEVVAQEQAMSQEDAAPSAGQSMPAPPIAPPSEPTVVSETGIEPLQGLVGYLLAALVMVVIVSSWLQWRASRQLRRALGQMGHLLHVVEDMNDKAARPQPASLQASPTMPMPLPLPALPAAVIEFSPVERALLEGLASGADVQEGELVKALQEKGFSGVLIKAVVGEIVRKTAGDGPPWIEVTYAHGRYAYALRPAGEASQRGARQGRAASP